MRLIDADELKKAMDTWDKFGVDGHGQVVRCTDDLVPYVRFADMTQVVDNSPTIDAVPREDYEVLERHFVDWEPVVRCKDCIGWIDHVCSNTTDLTNADDFCSYGEREDDD